MYVTYCYNFKCKYLRKNTLHVWCVLIYTTQIAVFWNKFQFDGILKVSYTHECKSRWGKFEIKIEIVYHNENKVYLFLINIEVTTFENEGYTNTNVNLLPYYAFGNEDF